MKYKVLHQDKRQHGSSQKPYPERIINNADNDEDDEREEVSFPDRREVVYLSDIIKLFPWIHNVVFFRFHIQL